jgi:hypothetical protein
VRDFALVDALDGGVEDELEALFLQDLLEALLDLGVEAGGDVVEVFDHLTSEPRRL